MKSQLEYLVHEVKTRKIFKRNKKDVRLKVLAALLYFLGLSFRKTSGFISCFQEISHESVRTYYHKMKEVIKPPEKRNRGLIAIDETNGD